jgi:hypothetical protein
MSAGESGSDAYPDLSQTIIIFLDIDGVLLPFGSHLLFPDAQLEALSIILQAFAEDHAVEIVLSSTWRVQAKFRQDILDQFDAYAYEYGGPLAQVQRFFDVTDIELHSERPCHWPGSRWTTKTYCWEARSKRLTGTSSKPTVTKD